MLFLAFFVIILLFGLVLLFGAPYLPTQRRQADAAFDLLDLKPGQTLYELGCGDGRILRQAAQRDLQAVGYELNPVLVIFAKLYTWKYRARVTVIWGNFWKADLTKADGIFVFLLDRFMIRLDQKLQETRHKRTKTVRLASYAFEIPGKKFAQEKQGVRLYLYK